MQKELLNILTKHADDLNMNKKMLFIQFVEMAYQYSYTESYLSKYRNAEKAFNDFFCLYLKCVCDKPFTDILGELMTEIDLVDIGKNTKLCQNLTPQDLSDKLSELVHSGINPKPIFERIVFDGFKIDKSFETINKFKIKSIVRKLSDKKYLKIRKVADICVGSGVLILNDFKHHLKGIDSGNYPMPLYYHLNDKDSLMCKVCAIQLHFNNLFNNKGVPFQYRITNHDAITEYEHFECKTLHKVQMYFREVEPNVFLRTDFHLMEKNSERIVIGSYTVPEITDKNIQSAYEQFLLINWSIANRIFNSSSIFNDDKKKVKVCQQA